MFPMLCRFVCFGASPVHVGDPAEIGIADITRPDFGDAVTVRDDEVSSGTRGRRRILDSGLQGCFV